MIKIIRKSVVHSWNFLFNHEVSPLRHIPDVAVRHYILQILGFIWAISFALAIGSYTFMAVSIIGHTVLIGAAAITVTTWTTASLKPEFLVSKLNRKNVEKKSN